jgi:Zn-dependent peptidase ImmA (M78 family)
VSIRSKATVEKLAGGALEKAGIKEAPVPVEEVAVRLGFQVVSRFFDDDNLSGTVFRDAHGDVVIGINTLHSPVRQRFSVAHEIGHALMHLAKGEALIVDPPMRSFFNRDELASLGQDSNEIEANQFAAALLMPAAFVSQEGAEFLSKSSTSTVDALVESLARRFEVSAQAIKFRLVNLGVIEPD